MAALDSSKYKGTAYFRASAILKDKNTCKVYYEECTKEQHDKAFQEAIDGVFKIQEVKLSK